MPADFGLTSAVQGDVLLVKFTGVSNEYNAQDMTRRYFDLVLGTGTRKILADLRDLHGRLSAGKTYYLLRDLPVWPVPAGIRTAILEAKDNRGYAQFLETTAVNAGIALKCFTDEREAMDWLAAGS